MSRVSVTPAMEQGPVCTHLIRRGSRYSIRRKIPVDLQGHYGRTEIVKALRTSDRREAERRCRVVGAELDQEFADAREALAASALLARVDSVALTANETAAPPSTSTAPPAPAFSRINADEVAARTLALLRQRRDAAAAQGYEVLAAFMDRTRNNLEDNEAVLRGELEALYPLSKHEGWRNALRAFLTGDGSVKELPEHIVAPATAQSTATPTRTALGQTTAPIPTLGTSLRDVAAKWAKERSIPPRTVNKAKLLVARFEEHMGDIKVEQITRRHVVDFKDKLLESGQSPVNTNKQLTDLNTLLNFAVKNSIIDQNPAKGIKVDAPHNAKVARIPFDLPALQAIFTSPVYALGERPKGGAGEAAYWLPLLGLYTGARIEELCQLHPDDVYQEMYRDLDDVERSAWVLRITDTGPGQAVKNAGSRRRFPVHPELIRLGFVQYALNAKGRDRIFDQLTPDVVGDESGNWSKWFGGYLRKKAGVADKRMVYHSFRHGFKDYARAMEIPEDVSDAITGHSSPKVSRRYGGINYPLRPLVEAMNRFRIIGFQPPAPPGTGVTQG